MSCCPAPWPQLIGVKNYLLGFFNQLFVTKPKKLADFPCKCNYLSAKLLNLDKFFITPHIFFFFAVFQKNALSLPHLPQKTP